MSFFTPKEKDLNTFIWKNQKYILTMPTDEFEKEYVLLSTLIEAYIQAEWPIEQALVKNLGYSLEAAFIYKLKCLNVLILANISVESFLKNMNDSKSGMNTNFYMRFIDCVLLINTICNTNFLNVLKGRFYKTVTDNCSLGNFDKDLSFIYPNREKWETFSNDIGYVYLLPHFQYIISVNKKLQEDFSLLKKPI